MNLETLLIFAAAVYGSSRLITRERGLSGVFQWLRELAGVKHDPQGNIIFIPNNNGAKIVTCPYCCSVWLVGFGLVIYLFTSAQFPTALPILAMLVAALATIGAVYFFLNISGGGD